MRITDELSLPEMLNEPIVRAVMSRDGVEPLYVADLCRTMGAILALSRPASLDIREPRRA